MEVGPTGRRNWKLEVELEETYRLQYNESTMKRKMDAELEEKRKQLEQQRKELEEQRKERLVHLKTRSDMMVKYFSEKVSPGVHDVAMKKEGFGVWKEEFMRVSFEEREKKSAADAEKARARHAEEVRHREEARKERVLVY
jgi:hypothetical protein